MSCFCALLRPDHHIAVVGTSLTSTNEYTSYSKSFRCLKSSIAENCFVKSLHGAMHGNHVLLWQAAWSAMGSMCVPCFVSSRLLLFTRLPLLQAAKSKVAASSGGQIWLGFACTLAVFGCLLAFARLSSFFALLSFGLKANWGPDLMM